MKKVFWAFILFFVLVCGVSANVTNFLVESNKTKLKTNDTFYISIFATDAQWAQVSTLDPKFIVENEAVKVWKFYNCSTAEGRELCGKYDQSFVGLQGAYVAQAKTTEQVWDFTISIFSDANKTNVSDIKISVEWVQTISPVNKEVEEVITLNEGPVAWTNINGKQYLYLGLFALFILWIYWYFLSKRNVYSISIKK